MPPATQGLGVGRKARRGPSSPTGRRRAV